MSQSRDIDAALRAVAAGEWDRLTPEQVDRLEHVLNDEPGRAAELAHQRPQLGPRFDAALEALARCEPPAPQQWQQVWQQIDTATGARPRAARRPMARIMRYWPGMLAAAACAVLALLWTVQPGSSDEWPLRLATSVEIDDLEVPAGATSFVVSIGDSGVQVIWVLDEQG
jgi:hypothetical protein